MSKAGFEQSRLNGETPSYLAKPMSKKPALVVLLAAICVTTGAFLLSLTNNSAPSEKPIQTTFSGVKGISLAKLIPNNSNKYFNIPRDLTAATIIPVDCQLKTITKSKSDSNDFYLYFKTNENLNSLIAFFSNSLNSNGFKLLGKNPKGSNAFQIIGEYPSLDGYYWEVGVTINYPTGPSASAETLVTEIFEEPSGS